MASKPYTELEKMRKAFTVPRDRAHVAFSIEGVVRRDRFLALQEAALRLGAISGEALVFVAEHAPSPSPSILVEEIVVDPERDMYQFAVTSNTLSDFTDAEFGSEQQGRTLAQYLREHFYDLHDPRMNEVRNHYRKRVDKSPVTLPEHCCPLEAVEAWNGHEMSVYGFVPHTLLEMIEEGTHVKGVGPGRKPIMKAIAHRLRVDIG